ncbi:DUF2877 domain-containing protein [Variibacter gotjawalensis]|uniref:DUF2877 domain-containing protein n=1 Tax=Variibacter gotjawalensis TaxID=1333996 RepID=UPI001AEFE293|nr:DUF2877 domain-containing protein [Variibacter gotjawalensis]
MKLGDQLICIGPHGLGDGPLNLLCDPFTHRLAIGDRVNFAISRLRLGSLIIDCANVSEWRPPVVASASREGLALLSPYIAKFPAEGLSRLLANDETTPVLRAARPAAEALTDFVGNATTEAPHELISIIGLGPGLTPSGDDFLGGAMIALATLNETKKRDAIWRLIAPHLTERTTDISAAHLSAAAEGYGHAALHAFIAALNAGENAKLTPAIDTLTAIGHTSGLDALAGAVTVFRASAPTIRG